MSSEVERNLNRLLERFAGLVRAKIASSSLNIHGIDPDDVEQEVRIRLWKALQRDPKADLPASYIQRVVVTAIVDAIRRAQVRAADPLPEPDSGHEPVTTRPGPDVMAGDALQIDVVMRCIQALPQRRRRPLQLYLQGFALREAADSCGLTLDAARKLIYRGLDELRDRLKDAGLGD